MTRRASRLGFALLGLGVAALSAPPSAADDAAEARAAWARVLERHVSATGSVDFEALREAPADLEAYVAWAARVGPRSAPERFPDVRSRLAYYIDTYNALAMWNVVHRGRKPEQKLCFFFLSWLPVDGGTRMLYTLENHVIRKLGDPRVHFALNCMARSCPRLPREPWSPERLDAQLDAAAREFVNEARNVRVVPERRAVWLSSIFGFFAKDFRAEAPSLIAYVNRYRDEPIPEDYEVEFLPYDWGLNQTPK